MFYPRKFTMVLAVALTDEQLKEKGDFLSGAIDSRELKVTEKKRVMKGFKDEISAYEADIVRTATQIRKREEHKQVDVEERVDGASNSIVKIRTDTGAELDRRAMTAAERDQFLQTEFDLDKTATEEVKDAIEATVAKAMAATAPGAEQPTETTPTEASAAPDPSDLDMDFPTTEGPSPDEPPAEETPAPTKKGRARK